MAGGGPGSANRSSSRDAPCPSSPSVDSWVSGASLGDVPICFRGQIHGTGRRAAALRLRSSDDKLNAIAAAVGYESVAAFAKSFKRHMGMTPGEYRKFRQPVGLG